MLHDVELCITSFKSCESIQLVKAGKDLDMELKGDDVSTVHPIPRYEKSAEEKIIVKFTRRAVRDDFYASRKKDSGKKASNLGNLKDACATAGVNLNQ